MSHDLRAGDVLIETTYTPPSNGRSAQMHVRLIPRNFDHRRRERPLAIEPLDFDCETYDH
jgi:hypothetical protein